MTHSTKVMIVGGCFDIIHPGHINFLQKAKNVSDYLIVLLESDKKVNWLKGENRPVNTENTRKNNLENLKTPDNKNKLIDEIIVLPFIRKSEEYQKLIEDIMLRINKNPPIIKEQEIPTAKLINMITTNKINETGESPNPKFYFGITKNPRNPIKNEKIHELSQKMNIEVIEVNELLNEYSTTNLINKSKPQP
jgi:cytidyltransferase-like protein